MLPAVNGNAHPVTHDRYTRSLFLPLLTLFLVTRRSDSPYTDDTHCPYPEGFEGSGDVNWLAQNEGQKVESTGLHFSSKESIDG